MEVPQQMYRMTTACKFVNPFTLNEFFYHSLDQSISNSRMSG